MSTNIDQQIVEMRFDNKQFESNVSSTMSLLDKLKQKLSFKGAANGLAEVGTAASKVDMSPLGRGVEAVQAKFSAMQVVGITALANITNSAVNAGKRIVSALTIDPVKAGLDEYETKMGSIQTILANTSHQGTTLDDVTAALNELNTYSDKTIYNFQEMARNIGTFTAAGIDLDTSVKSIQGIANLAAVSGSTSQQASTAMYQLSQALAAGTVKLMDWNSVVNAGMGGKVFQDALIRTAAMLDGSAKDVEAWQKEHIDAYGSFRESLSKEQWLTAEVLTTTLEQFTMTAEKGSAEWEEFKKSLMVKGYTEEQAEAILDMANTATNAATKVKTFSQLFDTLRETAQSGWAQTWELIIGDFEEAKEFLTGLSDMIGGFIDSMSKWRNNLLGNALNSNLDKLKDKLRGAGVGSNELEEKLREVAKTSGKTDDELDKLVTEFGSLAEAVKAGELGVDILKKALAALGIGTSGTKTVVADFVEKLKTIERILGYGTVGDDVKALQTALEALGHSVGKCGIDGIIGPDTTAAIKEFQKEAGIAVDGIAGPETLAALEKAGTSLENITGAAGDADMSYEDLIKNITDPGGRELLLEGLSNIINGLIGTFRAFGAAWNAIFPASGAQVGLLNAIKGFNEFTKAFKIFDTITGENGETIIQFTATGDKLVRVFKGLLAVVDIFLTVVGGPFKILLKAATQLLGYFGIGVLEGAATLGDALVKLRDFIDGTLDFTKVFDKIIPPIQNGIKKFREWIKTLKDSKDLPKDIAEGIASGIGKAFKTIKKFFTSLPKLFKNGFDGLTDNPLTSFIKKLGNGLKVAGQVFVELGKMALEKVNEFLSARGFKTISVDMIAGLVNGIKGGIGKVLSTIGELAKSLIEKVKDILGIESPSKVFIAIGGFIIAGLIAGVSGGSSGVSETFGKITSIISKVFGGIINLFHELAGTLGDIDWGSLLALLTAAGLVVSVIKFAKAIEHLAAPLEGLGDVLQSLSNVGNAVATNLKAEALKTMATAIAILVGAIVVLTLLDPIEVLIATGIVVLLAGLLAGLLFLTQKMGKTESGVADAAKGAVAVGKLAVFLISLAASIMLIALTMKLLSTLDFKDNWLDICAGMVLAIGAIVGVLAAFGYFTKNASAENTAEAAKMIRKMGTAILVIAIAMKIMESIDPNKVPQVITGLITIILGIGLIIGIFGQYVSDEGAKNIDQFGKMLRKLATSILIIAIVAKIIESIDNPKQAFGGLAAIVVMIGAVLAVYGWLVKGDSAKNLDKASGLFMALAASVLILTYTAKIISEMPWQKALYGAAGIVILLGILGVAIFAMSKIAKGKDLAGVGPAILSLSVALAALALVAKIIATMSWDEALIGGLGIIVLAAVIVVIMKTLQPLGKDQSLKGVGTTLLLIAGAIGILAVIAVLLGFVDPWKLLQGVLAVSILGLLMAELVRATKDAQNVAGTIVTLTVAIAILVAGVVVLSLLDPVKLAVAGGALIGLIAILSLLVYSTKNVANNWTSILAIAGMVAVLGGVIFLLGQLDWKSSLAAAGALSVTMFVLVGCLSLMSTIPKVEETVLLSLAMTVGMLGIVLYILGNLPLTGAIVATAALSITLLALVAAMSIMSTIPQISPAVIVSLLAMTAAIAVIGTIMSLLGGMGGSDIAMSLLAIGAALAILAVGLNVMNGTIEGSLALLIAVGALALLVPVLQQLSSVSWADIAKGLIIIAGAFAVLGIAGLLLGSLAPVIVALAGAFLMIGAATALLGIGLQAIATGFQNLATSVSENGAAFVSGMTVIITGLIALIPTVVAAIAQGLLTLIQTIATFIPAIADTAAKLVTSILETIAKYLPKIVKAGVEIIVGFIEGITKGLPKIIKAAFELVIAFINGLADGIRNNSDKVIAAVGNLVTAILGALGKVLGKVLKIGGDLAKKLGDGIKSGISKVLSIVKDMCTKLLNKIKEFPKKFIEVGKDLANGLVKGIKNVVPNAIKAVKNLGSSALKAICKVLGIKSPSREFMSIGKYSVEGFVKGLTDNSYLATGASSSIGEDALDAFKSVFSDNNGSINLGNLFSSGTATTAQIEGMQTALNTLLGTNLEVDGIIGPKTKEAITQFQKEYGLEITGTLNEETVKATQAALEERNRLLKQAELEQATLLHEQRIDVETRLASDNEKTKRRFADMIQLELVRYDEMQGGAYADGVPTINQLVKIDWNAVSSGDFSSLVDLGIEEFLDPAKIQKIADNYVERARIEEIVLESLANTWTPEMVKQYAALPEESKQAYVDQVQKTIDDIYKSTVDGIGDAPALLEGNEAQYQAVLEDYFAELFKDMEADGKHVAEGYAKGIEKGMPAVTSAVEKLTSITVNTTTRELAIHSPSRVFRNLGKFIPEGFAQGITSLSSVVGKSTSDMASVAVKGTSNAISKIVDTINSDIDTQPTIRPVLDLTDVEAGASAIGGMFGLNPSVGVLANVGSISASMNNRQNRSNEDVVTAIDKLRKDLSDMPRSTTTIGNITYDDGTNINTAVETLVRAARIGRRR